MVEHFVFLDCPLRVKRSARAYWADKERRVERLLATFRPELRHLRLSLRRHKTGWEARAVLNIPTATLVAVAAGATWIEALDMAADRLIAEIRRHVDRLRRRTHVAHAWPAAI